MFLFMAKEIRGFLQGEEGRLTKEASWEVETGQKPRPWRKRLSWRSQT
jgi:hypothetical protein